MTHSGDSSQALSLATPGITLRARDQSAMVAGMEVMDGLSRRDPHSPAPLGCSH